MNMATSKTSHQRQIRRRRRNVNPHFKNFLDNTSLHGVKYIFDSNRHWIERCFWCIVVICFISSLFAIYRMKMNKWKEDPMTIEVANTSQHISTLPNPALTICGPVLPLVEQVVHLKEKLGDETYKIADIFGMPRKAFDEMFNMSSTENSTDSNRERFVISDLSLETFIHYPMFHHLLSFSSRFHSGLARSTFLFREYCLSTNMIPPSKIYKMNTVQHHLDLVEGSMSTLNITLQLNTDLIDGFPSYTEHWLLGTDDAIQPLKIPVLVRGLGIGSVKDYREKGDIKFIGRDKGYRFTIHNPWDVPSPFMRWHRFQPSESRVIIEPEVIIKYPVDDNDFLYRVPYAKQCYNTTEKKLEFFQYYTQQNCLMECSTKRALRECGCVLFYMPHNESTYICSDEYNSCAVNVAKATYYDTGDRNFVDTCDCLPSCNYTDYKVISYETETSKYKHSYAKISFRDVFFLPKVRTYTYNNNEMVDATVVYLDAFLGVSIMTVAEIFYYMLLYVIDYLKSKIQQMLDWLCICHKNYIQ